MRTLTEILVEALSNTKIFEMANSRENYITLSRSLMDQIVQNWCLIKYCNLYDEENYNRLHWSNELIAHIGKLLRQKIKGGINKERTTKIAWIELEEINDPEIVEMTIVYKFDEEGIKTDLNKIANEFIKQLDKIVYIISNGTPSELKKYVYEEI